MALIWSPAFWGTDSSALAGENSALLVDYELNAGGWGTSPKETAAAESGRLALACRSEDSSAEHRGRLPVRRNNRGKRPASGRSSSPGSTPAHAAGRGNLLEATFRGGRRGSETWNQCGFRLRGASHPTAAMDAAARCWCVRGALSQASPDRVAPARPAVAFPPKDDNPRRALGWTAG